MRREREGSAELYCERAMQLGRDPEQNKARFVVYENV
jgi:hypothetical protein